MSETVAHPGLSMRVVRNLSKNHSYYPSIGDDGLVVEVLADAAGFPAGHRGVVCTSYGTGMYDWHLELPVDGSGVPHAEVAVVERHESGEVTKTPYFEWCRRLGLCITCSRCGLNILETHGAPCPEQARRDRAARDQRRAERDFERRRATWVAAEKPSPAPVLPAALPEARELCMGRSTLEEAQTAAAEYQFEFAGVHVVPRGDSLSVFGGGFREPPDGLPHPDGPVSERSWPIPVLY